MKDFQGKRVSSFQEMGKHLQPSHFPDLPEHRSSRGVVSSLGARPRPRPQHGQDLGESFAASVGVSRVRLEKAPKTHLLRGSFKGDCFDS